MKTKGPKHDYFVYICRAIEDLDECMGPINRYTHRNIVVHVPSHVLYFYRHLWSYFLKGVWVYQRFFFVFIAYGHLVDQ